MNETIITQFSPNLKALWIEWIFLSLITLLTGGLAGIITVPYSIYKYLEYKNVKYTLTDQRLKIEWGILSKHQSQIDLFRLKDIQFDQSFSQRTVECGNLVLISTDISTPMLKLKDLLNPRSLMETIRQASENRRAVKKMGTIEYV